MKTPIETAQFLVHREVKNNLLEITDNTPFEIDNVYVVWFCYILGGWKALVSTSLPDGMYYEVTCNISKREIYLDAYKKFKNVQLSMEE